MAVSRVGSRAVLRGARMVDSKVASMAGCWAESWVAWRADSTAGHLAALMAATTVDQKAGSRVVTTAALKAAKWADWMAYHLVGC